MTKPNIKYDEDLRTWLTLYRGENGLSNKDIATQLGTNTTAVSKYLNGKPEGNTVRLESLIADLRKAAEQHVDTETFLFENSISQQLSQYCDLARKTGDFTLIHSPAGLGKTCAIELYKRANPLCLDITLNIRHRDAAGVERLVFNRLDVKSWNMFATDRWTFLVERLRSSGRLLLIDNAQRITKAGLKWIYDFHDYTKCPVALIGNPEVIELIEPDDQQFSRTGVKHELTFKNNKEIQNIALRLAGQYLPDDADHLTDLIYRVASEHGHLRSLKKQLVLTSEILKAGRIVDAEEAFRAAHIKMIRHYKL